MAKYTVEFTNAAGAKGGTVEVNAVSAKQAETKALAQTHEIFDTIVSVKPAAE